MDGVGLLSKGQLVRWKLRVSLPPPHCGQRGFSECHTAHVDALLSPSPLVFFAFEIKVNSLTRPAQFGSSSHPHFPTHKACYPGLGSSHTDYLLHPHLLYAFPHQRGFALQFFCLFHLAPSFSWFLSAQASHFTSSDISS